MTVNQLEEETKCVVNGNTMMGKDVPVSKKMIVPTQEG